jgi:hypothetical protein
MAASVKAFSWPVQDQQGMAAFNGHAYRLAGSSVKSTSDTRKAPAALRRLRARFWRCGMACCLPRSISRVPTGVLFGLHSGLRPTHAAGMGSV